MVQGLPPAHRELLDSLAALPQVELLDAPATVAEADRGPEPLIGRWEPEAIESLREAVEARVAARALVAELGMSVLRVDAAEIANVNTEAELELSAAFLRRARS